MADQSGTKDAVIREFLDSQPESPLDIRFKRAFARQDEEEAQARAEAAAHVGEVSSTWKQLSRAHDLTPQLVPRSTYAALAAKTRR